MAKKKTVKSKSALEEWKKHNPFQRASQNLIRQAEKELKNFKPLKQEEAPF